jgi:hypothetical protein
MPFCFLLCLSLSSSLILLLVLLVFELFLGSEVIYELLVPGFHSAVLLLIPGVCEVLGDLLVVHFSG